jgi:hypothetical protein
MSTSMVYQENLETDGLVNVLETHFGAEGYEVQHIGSGDDVGVQIRKKGLGRAALGLQQALTVRIKKEGQQTRVSLGQAKWADKAGVEIIGALVFWPLMIPATYGVVKQSQLPRKVQAVIDDYVTSHGTSTRPAIIETMVACPECGVANSSVAQFCSACGATLTPTQKA